MMPRALLAAACAVALLLAAPAGPAATAPSVQICRPAAPAFGATATASQLGCATSEPFVSAAAEQALERGRMLWLQEWAAILVLAEDASYTAFDDLYSADEPVSLGLAAPAPGLIEPRQGFGEVWRGLGGPDAPIGWATAPEESAPATVQYFERGAVIQVGDRAPYALQVYNHARGRWAQAP